MRHFLLLLIFLSQTGLVTAQSWQVDTLWCSQTPVYFKQVCWQVQPGIQFLHVHENEKTAVIATTTVLTKNDRGCFVTWQSQDDRYVAFEINGQRFKIDPNRIYSARGLEATLRKNGAYSVAAFERVSQLSQTFLEKYVNHNKLLVAVHNNTEGELTVHSFVKSGETSNSYVNKKHDPDDFFLTTDPWIFNYLKQKGFNVVLQKKGIADDGSLSVYAAKNKIAYINIEAQHGHLDQQKEMVEAVMKMIDERFQ